MYNAKSSKAEEFINHEEILDTLAYAEANKANAALIDQILCKARRREGLTHREAAVLLDCEWKTEQGNSALAEQIRRIFRKPNRHVRSHYLSNYCVYGCVY